MKKHEVLGMLLGSASVLLFWVPPIGLVLGVAGVAVTATRMKQRRELARFALILSILGLALYIGFWTGVWLLSQ